MAELNPVESEWKWKLLSRVWLFATPWTIQSMEFSGQNTGVGSQSILQGIFPTQGSNPGLLHCRRILYHLSHQGSPRILEWGAYPFSSGSSRPRNEPGSPALHCRRILYQLSYHGSPLKLWFCIFCLIFLLFMIGGQLLRKFIFHGQKWKILAM